MHDSTRAYPNAPARPVLRDVQHALAREHGHESWIALKQALEQPTPASRAAGRGCARAEEYERLAQDYVLPSTRRMQRRSQRLNEHYQPRVHVRRSVGGDLAPRVRVPAAVVEGAEERLQLDEAQMLVAQDAGFGSWDALTRVARDRRVAVPPYAIDTTEQRDRAAPAAQRQRVGRADRA